MAQTTPSEVAGANSAAPVAVLVVDGKEAPKMLSIAALTRKGWTVRTAATRKQGLQLALAYHFDAVVIGSKLRDGTGIELLRALGGRLPGTPIIFVVPLGGEEAALQAMASGAQSYIVKTPRYNELLPAIVEEHVVEARNRKRLVENEEIQAQAVTARKTVFFFQAEDGIRDVAVTGVQTCALPISEGMMTVPLPKEPGTGS